MRNNQAWLRTVISVRLGEYAAVEDVWQEVALAAVKQQSPIQDATRVKPWLYQLAIRQTSLYKRTMGRRRKLLERYTKRANPSEFEKRERGPLEILLDTERKEQVRAAVELLPPIDREAILLRYVHDWSYNDMAENLGISIAAIKARLHRARQHLRNMLAYNHFVDFSEDKGKET